MPTGQSWRWKKSRCAPAEPTESFIELRDRDWTVQVATLGEDVEYFAFVFPAISAALYATALAISRDRRGPIAAVGLGWVTVAALLMVSRDYAREVVLDQGAFENRAVTEAIWDTYTASLTGWAILVGGFGLTLAIGATGTRRRVDVQAQLAVAMRMVSRMPASPAGRVARAATFVAAGLVAVREASRVLEVMAVLAGAYAIYYGVSELVWLAGPAAARVSERPGRGLGRARAAGKVALRTGAVGALVLAGAGGGFISWQAVETVGGETAPSPVAKTCNGYEALCDRRLDEVAFLGTHNSMAAATEPGWYLAEHYVGIDGQLKAGVRAFLLDTWYGYDTGKGVRTANRDIVQLKLPPGEYRQEVIAAANRLAALIGEPEPGAPRGTYLCHSSCELGATPLQQALRTIETFLQENPGEVVIIFFQDQISPEDTAKAFISSGLVRRVFRPVEGEPFPTLREMVERDERVVVLADNDASGVDWYLQGYDYVQEAPFSVRRIEDLSCKPGRGAASNPLFALNHWISTSIPSPEDARVMNGFDFLYGRARRCERERGRMVNLVNVNFAEVGDALRVVQVLNGVEEPPGGEEEESQAGE